MNEEEMHDLAQSIKDEGPLKPLVLDPDGVLLDGRKHGSYSVRQELPPREDGTRRSFSRAGYETLKAAQGDLDHIRALLGLAETDDIENLAQRRGELRAPEGGRRPRPDPLEGARPPHPAQGDEGCHRRDGPLPAHRRDRPRASASARRGGPR
ncbi:hypothetical protein [Streptomyces sp. NPDC058401]|uniref:hypothetical protein n=1 Tax=Streptomyces sp. NPDC058401 TaxID=3346480 RepID=UPI00365D89D3